MSSLTAGGRSQEVMGDPAQLIAVAADFRLPLDLPQFDLDDATGLADFIEQRFLLQSS